MHVDSAALPDMVKGCIEHQRSIKMTHNDSIILPGKEIPAVSASGSHIIIQMVFSDISEKVAVCHSIYLHRVNRGT